MRELVKSPLQRTNMRKEEIPVTHVILSDGFLSVGLSEDQRIAEYHRKTDEDICIESRKWRQRA